MTLQPDQPAGPRRRPRRKQARTVTAPVKAAWAGALACTEADVDAYKPTPAAGEVALALLAGATSIVDLVKFTGLPDTAVKEVLALPVAMAWVSRQVKAQFTHRAGLVDAALFQRACNGDVNAISLFYKRFDLLADERRVRVEFSGGVDLRAVPTQDLEYIVRDRVKSLPAEFRLLQAGAGEEVPGAGGAREAVPGGPAPLLPPPAGEPPEAARLP